MPKIRVINEYGELIQDIDCIGYNLQYVESTGNGQIQKIRALNNGKWGYKHWIKNDFYKPIAQKIKNKYAAQFPDFTFINLDKILFIEDMEYIGDEVKRDDYVMWIKKLPKQVAEFTGYEFIIESRDFWMSRMSDEQVVAHIYSCLRQIEDGTKLKAPDLVGWKEVIGTLGYGWETTISPIPDLMNGFDKEEFRMLRKADKQVTMFDRAVK